MKKLPFIIFLFLLSVQCSFLFSQRPEATINKLPDDIVPVIDGSPDYFWSLVSPNELTKPISGEAATFNTAPYWKAVWNNEAIYIIIDIRDDEWAPSWITGLDNWLSDKPEVYFDVNAIIHNGGAASEGANGHYQVAPNYGQTNQGVALDGWFGQGGSFEYAYTYNATGSAWMEYKIPFASLVDSDGNGLDPVARPVIGFDVTIIDNTPSNTAVTKIGWSNDGIADYDNDGSTGENWTSLDDAGEITFSSTEVGPFIRTGKQFLSFSIDNIEGVINNQDISLSIPDNMAINALTPVFEASPKATVKIGEEIQESGITTVDLTNPVTYTVIAEDGSSVDYIVTVTTTKWSAGFPAIDAGITEGSMTVSLIESGVIYYLVSHNQQPGLTASEIQAAVKSGITGTDSIVISASDDILEVSWILYENETYYIHLATKTGGSLDTQILIKELSTHAYEEIKPLGTTDAPLGFIQYIPEIYYSNPSDSLPVVFYLHGIGFEGDGSYDELIYKVRKSIPYGVKNIPYDHILIVPQSLPYWWDGNLLEQTLEYLTDNYRIDKNRIYFTGLSMGGGGTTLSLDLFGDKIAAAVPVAPAGILARKMANVPVWTIHNKYDEVVPVEHSYFITDSILVAEGNTILSIFPIQSHDAWETAYRNQHMWQWLFAQEKDKPYEPANVITANETVDPIILDGLLNENFWNPSEYLLNGSDTIASYQMSWCEAGKLYIAIEVFDNELVSGGSTVDMNDAIELFFDTDYNHGSFSYSDRYFSFVLNDNQPREKYNKLSGVTPAWSETTEGYILELEIDLANYAPSSMTKGYIKGHTIGLDMVVQDKDADGVATKYYLFGNANNNTSCEQYGTLSFLPSLTNGTASIPKSITYTTDEPIIDGEKEEIWDEASLIDKNLVFIKGVPDADFNATLHALYDENNLYIHALVNDPQAVASLNGGYQKANDHIDIMVDMDCVEGTYHDNSNYFDANDYQFMFKRGSSNVSIGNQVARDVSGLIAAMEVSTTEVTGGWSLEVKIPFNKLDPSFSLQNTPQIGFDFVVGDNDNTNSTDAMCIARMGNRLERNSDFIMSAVGAYHTDPVSWMEVFLKRTGDEIYTYSINGINGRFNGDSVYITLPQETEITALKADFILPDGASLKISDVIQENGVTVNDYSNPISVDLHLENGSIKPYKVFVFNGYTHPQIQVYYQPQYQNYRDSIHIYAGEKLEFFRKVPYPVVNNRIFKFKFCSDSVEFSLKKPASLPDFETSYFVDDIIYIMRPESEAQKQYFPDFSMSIVHAFSKAVLELRFSGNIEDWLLQSFARYEAGMLPSPDEMQSQLDGLPDLPGIDDLRTNNLPDGVDYDDMSTSLMHFLMFKFGHKSISPNNIQFSNGDVSFNFWSFNTKAMFNELWAYFINLFYLDNDNLIEIQKTSENFKVWTASSDITYVDDLIANAEEAFSGFIDSMNINVSHKLNLVVYPTLCIYHNSVGVDECNPNSVGGGVDLETFQMVSPSGVDRPLESMFWLMKHELAHVVQFLIKPNFMPAWLSEGYAMFMPTGRLDPETNIDMSTRLPDHLDALETNLGRLPTLAELQDYGYLNSNNIDYYLIGHAMVDWLMHLDGYEALKALIQSNGLDISLYGYSSQVTFMNDFYQWVDDVWREKIEKTRISATIPKITGEGTPVIDGAIDDFWKEVTPHTLEKSFVGENPVFNTLPTWKAVWNEEALYVLVETDDNEWAPVWITGVDNWLSDKPEVYFDVNAILHNGEGASEGANGHYVVTPDYGQTNQGVALNGWFGQGGSFEFEYAYTYNSIGSARMEYKIPFSSLVDSEGNGLNPATRPTIGFDVVVVDNTPDNSGRNRAVWSNDGVIDYNNDRQTDENWALLDDAGVLTFGSSEIIIEGDSPDDGSDDGSDDGTDDGSDDDGTTNVEDRQLKIVLYPNPTDGNVMLSGLKAGEWHFSIYSTNGYCLYSENKIVNNSQIHIDINDYPAGLYIIRAVHQSDSFIVRITKE